MKLYMKILVLSASITISSLYTNVTLSLLYADAGLFSDIQNTDADIHSGI